MTVSAELPVWASVAFDRVEVAKTSGSAARRTATATVVVVAAVVAVSREVAGAFWGTSYLVLVAAAASAMAILRSLPSADGEVGRRWGRRAGAVAAILLTQPMLWSAVALADHWVPGTLITWAFAVVAGTGHLPLIATFALLPLWAIEDLGIADTRRSVLAISVALAAAVTSFALFFSEFAPFDAAPLVRWEHGDAVGAALNLAFLGCVLVGPARSLFQAHRGDVSGAQPMARLALASFGGVAIVLFCGALGTPTGLGVVTLYVGLDVAVGVSVVGTLAVVTQGVAGDAAPLVRISRLSERESEVLAHVADGLTNAGIAERLFVSERTVDAHLRSIFTKLDLPEGPLVNRRVHAAMVWSQSRAGVE